jgi:hypothetical protein
MVEQPSLGLRPLSRVHLDELLQEMLDRVGDVMASRERLRALLDAVVGIGTDLDLRSTLKRIVEAACALAGAKYGALGVIGADRTELAGSHWPPRPGSPSTTPGCTPWPSAGNAGWLRPPRSPGCCSAPYGGPRRSG